MNVTLGQTSYALTDSAVLAALLGALALLLVVWLMLTLGRRSREATRAVLTLASQMGGVTARVQSLADGQQQMAGGLEHVSQAQAAAQAQMLRLMEERLAKVTETMGDSLANSSRNTAQSLGELQQRLQAIDKAQDNITKLSGDVLSLQDILSNKQTRGAFGEIQLYDILHKALPKDSFSTQVSLSNGRRADAMIHLPNPPGPIVIDSKFPLEAYELLRAAKGEREALEAQRAFRTAVRTHIRAIADRYVIEGETGEGALMFLPSEAVYAELHANFGELVREGFERRVWTVSPTTCMATLNTMRAILKDARMREQAGEIRKMLRLLHRDVELVGERVGRLNQHFNQARGDLGEITTAAERAGKRAARLDNFDFEEIAPEAGSGGTVVPLARPEGRE